ncbi:MAG: hypothetical protein WC548_02810 [Candidatus Pacearchaeota archaeon]
MVEKLYFKEHKSSKPWIIVVGILVGVIFFYYLFNQISIISFGTDPEEVLNYTHGEFAIKSHSCLSFQDYYAMLAPKEEIEFYSSQKLNYTLEVPKLEFNYKFYDYGVEYYDYCEGKKVEINFTNPQYSEFQFNYKDVAFDYKINLYPDLYYFSDNLKNQDCYFDTYKYTEGFLEDPYNNNFIDSISKDFIALKDKGYSDDEIVEIATLFVQSIPYGTDYTNLNRYPYETLFEKEGNCLDKSVILTGILRNLGYTSYIILGDSDYQYHALVGIVCDDGNIQYEEKDICFIETTIFTPITSDVEIDIEEYVKTSEGSLVYSGASYGKDLINYFESRYNEVLDIESQLDSMELELNDLQNKMCNTDCSYCNPNRIDPLYCDDAYEYNKYVGDYNEIIEEYNVLVEEWYKPYYDLEKSMFDNVELIARPF